MNTDEELTAKMEELGRQVREVREFRCLTREAVAREADVGVMTLTRIEAGNAAVGLFNVEKVLRVLGLSASLVPPGMPSVPAREDEPCHAKHVASEETAAALDEAVSAACRVLDEWLAVKHPERDGISSNFQGQLREHLEAMLCGRSGSAHRVSLKRLVYSDDFVGGPLHTDDASCQGWVLRLRGEGTVLEGRRVMRVKGSEVDPYTSRQSALAALREYIEQEGHPPGAIDAVPVFLDEHERYRF